MTWPHTSLSLSSRQYSSPIASLNGWMLTLLVLCRLILVMNCQALHGFMISGDLILSCKIAELLLLKNAFTC